jgi:predicted ester cyclase
VPSAEARTAAAGEGNATVSNEASTALATQWKDLWNGDLGIADKIIAEDFVAHAAPLTGTGPDEIRGREALKDWIAAIHTVLAHLTFAIDVGPIADHDHLVVRWTAHGTYRGGFPGASPEAAGREVTFTGADILRTADGKLAEYWANADSLLFFEQLGVREIPVQ